MKTITIISIISLFFLGCKEKPDLDVPSLLMGKWKLIEYKQENQQWIDSSGVFYNFISATKVDTKKFIYDCEREYQINNSIDGLLQIDFLQKTTCFYQDWRSIIIVSINSTTLEVKYPDYVGGGGLIYKYERFKKE